MLTFEQFQASRKEVDDLKDYFGTDDMENKGFLYADDCVIETISGEFGYSHVGEYLLIIDNQTWVSADLQDLERKLYDLVYVTNNQ